MWRYPVTFVVTVFVVLVLHGWLVRESGLDVYWLVLALSLALGGLTTRVYYLSVVISGTRRIIGDVSHSQQWRNALQRSAAELLAARQGDSSLSVVSRNFRQIRTAAKYFDVQLPDHVEACTTWSPKESAARHQPE